MICSRIVHSLLQIVLKCLYLARIGRPHILWSVNRLARAATKWTKACDKQLARLISYIHHTCEFRQHCYLGNTAQTVQAGTNSRLWFCQRSTRLKINIRWTLAHFRKSNIWANKLDVQETDISLTQLNRSWTYFSGCRFTHGRNSSAWSLGLSDWNISFLTKPNQQIQRSGVTGKPVAWHLQPSTTILIWVMLIMSRGTRCFLDVLRCGTFLNTTKQLLKWSSKAEVQRWDTYPEPTELLLIGCLTELIWTPKFKSSTLTPKTNSQTHLQREISHVMNGIISWPCLILAILALLPASQRWQNELNKNQEKDVSQPNHDPWWIWPQERLRSCLLQPHQTRGGPRMDIKILENLFQVTIERRNLWNRRD